MKLAVIGSGSFGTSMSSLLGKKGYDVSMWSFLPEEAERIERERENKEFLKGIILPPNVHCTNDIKSAVEGAELVVTVVPSFATRQTAKALSEHIKKDQIIVNLSKGLENDTLLRMTEVYQQEIPQAYMAAMSGPSHAEEVALGLPTTNVIASKNSDITKHIQDIFMDKTFRVYESYDMIGVEIGGALKNVIALCAGICDGLGFGDNTKAALMTRGMAEIKRVGIAMGADAETFAGLSGIGDLIVTCTSMHSRNRRAGILIGKGKTLEEAQNEVHMVVEGVHTAKAAYALSKKYNVHMPIVEQANAILFENKDPRLAVDELMMRDKTIENL